MADSRFEVELARLGHCAWCDLMRQEGWQAGTSYNESTRVHDALVPFEALRPADRRAAVIKIESEDFVGRLVKLVTPDRSDRRPFDASELRVGMRVGLGQPAGEKTTDIGEIKSWKTDEEGAVVEVTVRWADGTVSSFDPLEGVLRRL